MAKYTVDKKQQDRLQAQHDRVQKDIAALPEEKRKVVLATQKLVDYEMEQANELYFSDEMFATDKFLIDNNLPAVAREELQDAVKRTPKGNLFVLRNKTFVRTYNNMIFPAQQYLKSLELTIADQVQFKEVKVKRVISELDGLSFVQLIKLAFKRLLGGNNGKQA